MTVPTVFDDLDDLRQSPVQDLGSTEWLTLDADSVAAFCAAAGASLPAPGGGAPEFLLLSLTNRFLPELMQVPAASSGLNYGADRVRFPGPAYPGDRLRGSARLMEVTEVAGGVQTRVEIRVEVEGHDQPCCTVESLSRWLV